MSPSDALTRLCGDEGYRIDYRYLEWNIKGEFGFSKKSRNWQRVALYLK